MMSPLDPLPWPWTDPQALRFDRFMQAALHDSRRGYYARRIRGVGRDGDFTTAPMISGLLARGIAQWAAKALRDTGTRNLIEIGPGEGRLASAVLRALPLLRRWRTRLHLVETSAPLREKQQALLGKQAVWHDSVEAALDACQGLACLYSNELLDAFPARRFRLEGWGVSELYLLPGEIPRESWLPAEPFPASGQFAQTHRPGQILEVHESIHQWLQHWTPHWKRGAMLTIDYGADAASVYHRRPRGTLRAYLLHQRLEGHDVYRNAGRQDITADIDFTDYDAWLHQFLPGGNSRLLSQRDFLLPLARKATPADQAILDPEGAGTAFQVHEFRK